MLVPNRHGSSNSYRYGFNGMEKDDELKGEGNSYTTEFRQFDPRVGRWLSLDPLMANYSDLSPYVSFNNNPILYNDPYGLEGENTIDPPKKHKIKSGETLSGIAKDNNTTVDNLAIWNEIANPDKINAGNEIVVSDPTQYNKFANMTVGDYYGGGDVEITLSGDNFENESVYTQFKAKEDKKRWDALESTLMVFDVLSLGSYSASRRSTPKPKGYNPNISPTSVSSTGTRIAGGNRIKNYSYSGKNYQFNSSHGYDRAHATGTVTRKATYQQVESIIVKNARVNHSLIPTAEPGVKPYSGTVNVAGQNIGYSATQTGGKINIGTYFPK